MRTILAFAEKGFGVVALLIFPGALIPLLYQENGIEVANTSEGLPALQIASFGIYVIALCLLFLRWKRSLYTITKSKPLLFLIGITLASALWSDAPALTLRRGAALVGTTLFGLYLATRYSLREQLQLLAWTLGIAALSSLMFGIALPAYGVDKTLYAGAWRGVFVQKNVLGRHNGSKHVCILIPG